MTPTPFMWPRLFLYCLLVWLPGLPAEAAPGSSSGPNILVIIADDLGWNDVGYHGSPIATPHLDQLARDGLRLERFYVAPICSPTRAGFLTGRYPHRYGLRSTTVTPWREDGLAPEEVTLAEILAEAGYRHRALIGKWHLGHGRRDLHPLRQGFSEFYGFYNGGVDYIEHTREGERDWHEGFEPSFDEGYTTELLEQRAVTFLRQRQGEAEPFYLQLAFNAPHSPLMAEVEDLERYGYNPHEPHYAEGDERAYGSSDKDRFSFQPGHHTGNSARQTYSSMVTRMDDSIGSVLQALEDTGAENNTIVLFFSDNGGQEDKGALNDPLRGGKSTVWEGGVRVPALVRWPGMLPTHWEIHQLTSYLDWFPTLLGILGLDASRVVPHEIDGVDIMPLLRGAPGNYDRELYLGQGSVVSQHWKLIEDQLYRIDWDLGERHDLSLLFPEIKAHLRNRLAEFEALRMPGERPSYETGRDGFVAPRHWAVKE